MNFKRIGRLLVCLVLICALLINVSPIKARADVVAGSLAIVKASTVTCNPYIVCAAILIACGVYAGVSTGAFENLVYNCADAMEAAGTYVKDGMVEMYRFVTDTGEAMYYVGADFLETVRGWLFDSNSIYKTVSYNFPASLGSEFPLRYSECLKHKVFCCFRGLNDTWYCCYSDSSYFIHDGSFVELASGEPFYFASTSKNYFSTTSGIGSVVEFYNPNVEALTSDLDVSLGVISTVPIDGTSARAWSEAYANRGLYIASGGSQNPDDGGEGNEGWKFLLPLAFLTGADLWAMSQADQWTGSTPPEFDDYSTEEELTVTPAPEFDGYQAIEIAPVTNPNPDPGPGTGSDPDSGGESAESTWWQRLYQWLLEIKTSINELPNKFDEHFENLNNNIQEAPNKFETWIQNVQTSVDAVAESILGTADEINATINELPNTFLGQLPVLLSAIAAVPEAIVAGLRSLFQELFVPSQEYLNNKLQELVQSYPYLEPIISLGDTFKGYLTGINPTPPVIWIDLGASAWYPLGGRVKFIDLTWYAQYKPTVDGIMGAFLWLWFLWRLFQSAPGIVSGASGLFGHPDSHPDASFYGPNMISEQRFLGSGNGLNRNE